MAIIVIEKTPAMLVGVDVENGGKSGREQLAGNVSAPPQHQRQ
jgi:hypothetical protein